jgi:chromosome segregation ATPase
MPPHADGNGGSQGEPTPRQGDDLAGRAQLRQELCTATAQLSRLKDELASVAAARASLQAETDDLRQRLAMASAERQSLASQITLRTRTIEEMDAELEEVHRQIAVLKESCSHSETRLRLRLREVTRIEADLQFYREEAYRLGSSLETLRGSFARMDRKLASAGGSVA